MPSRYEFACVCGRKIISESKEGECPECGRLFEVKWGEQDKEILERMRQAGRSGGKR